MKREWKPGDVAMVRFGTSDWEVAIRQDDGTWACKHRHDVRGLNDVQARPLVVIDPEDSTAAEALCKAFVAAGVWQVIPAEVENMRAYRRTQVQDALRSLIAPPKPDEPTGLGAVVETESGERWIRTADTDCVKPWSYANNFTDAEWDQVNAVRVLSEGVAS